MRLLPAAAALTAALAVWTLPADAQSRGDWTVGIGFGYILPKDDNGSLLDGAADLEVGDNGRPTFTAEYFIWDNVGIELLAALPFEHNLFSDDLGGQIGSTKHLPPTLSLQYHFPTGTAFTPFLGAGLNYTTFFDEDATGAIEGEDLSIGDSWGIAFHGGVDYAFGERGAFRADVRWIDIDAEVKLNGDDIGDAEIDPWVFGVSYIYKF
ncbi:MAG: OmpW family outer membrane protein [Pseudomonadota bacterium]